MSLLEQAPVLLMTATIEPRAGLPGRVLTDPAVRRAAYERNLEYWLRSRIAFRAIVVAENSSANLDNLLNVAEKAGVRTPVEILKLGSEFPGKFGKGFGEALLLEAALESAAVFRESVPVVKVTGLQRVVNLASLLSKAPTDTRLMIDIREHDLYRRLGMKASGFGCDTRCLLFNSTFYANQVAGLWKEHVAGEFYIEDALYQLSRRLRAETGVYVRFPIEPDYRGLAGHWGKNYDSVGQRAKWAARATLRRLVPGLWI